MAKAKKAAKKAAPKKAVKKAMLMNVEVHARFDNTGDGSSSFTASHNGNNPQSLTGSGSVFFIGVKKNDAIDIDCVSPGNTTINVSGANTNPVEMTAVPGEQIADFFLIK